MTRWAVYEDGLRVWVDGELVAVIPPEELKHIIADAAELLRWHETEKIKRQST